MKPLDSLGKIFLVACGVLFLAAVGFRLNGSSAFVWKDLLLDNGSEDGLLLGAPQKVRSDESEVWTPALLSQAQNNFPAENPALGAGKAPFLYSLPVRHYTMLFRPQLYGFFLLDLEHGYAWYWNMKVFGLLASIFLLLWTLTRNSALSLFGSLWLFFSSYVQWWFSCPPMLPEMLSSWALALVAAVTLLRTRRWSVRISAALVFLICAVNFTLCLYPPFQIPLLYLGLFLFGAILYRGEEKPKSAWLSMLCLAGAIVAVAAVLVPFFIELHPTFEILSSTAYPGQRRSHGGEMSWMQLFSGVMNFFNSSTSYPDHFGQPNEAANFFPLWIPALAVTARELFAERRKNALALAALAVILGLSFYALCPLPQWLCRATLLSYCTEVRVLLAVGVANVLFVMLTFPLVQERMAATKSRTVLALVGFLACLVWLYLWSSVQANPIFLGPGHIALFFGLSLALIIAFLKAPPRVFFAAFIVLLMASNGLVNPVMAGLGPLAHSIPGNAVKELIRKDPGAKWVAYESNQNSEFLMAMGANVVSGVKTVPDLAFYKTLDPEEHDQSIYNRYSFAYFTVMRNREAVTFRSVGFPTHLVGIHPLHAALRARNVRYFLFGQPIADPAHEGIQLLAALPQNRMWIYGVIPDPAVPVLAKANAP